MSSLDYGWKTAWLSIGFGLVALLVVFRETALGMFEIWWRSETYAHGLLIVPITVWLVWRKRHLLHAIPPQPAAVMLIPFALGVAAWMVAHIVGVQFGEQIMLVFMVIMLVWSVLGHAAAKMLVFPLCFLFFAVPMGEDLVPPMMEFTATFTVWMLQVTGIPVYREGMFFVIPSGSWSIVEGCSGVRYLIASVTLGFLYAYLTYRSFWRRLAFVALSIAVPVIANGLRAYMIVMIGHLSDMKLAHGVDHLIYGWVFFGFVMLVMFWIGSFWSEPSELEPEQGSARPAPVGASSRSAFVAVAVVGVLIGLGAQTALGYIASQDAQTLRQFATPDGIEGWVIASDSSARWVPLALPTAHRLSAVYRKGVDQVQVDVALYPAQRQDAEAVNSQNMLVRQKDPDWRIVGQSRTERGDTIGPSAVNAYRIAPAGSPIAGASPGKRLLAWQWYRLGPHETAHPYVGKLLTAVNLVYPGRRDGAYVVIATELGEDPAQAERTLGAFVTEMGPELNRAIDAAVIGPALR
jgi:exosortase A